MYCSETPEEAVQSCGTSDAIVERLRARRDVMGDYELNVCARFGGLNMDRASGSLRRFATEVVPALRDL